MNAPAASVCHRCGNHLALGMAILYIHTMQESFERKLCGACNTDLKAWFAAYAFYGSTDNERVG